MEAGASTVMITEWPVRRLLIAATSGLVVVVIAEVLIGRELRSRWTCAQSVPESDQGRPGRAAVDPWHVGTDGHEPVDTGLSASALVGSEINYNLWITFDAPFGSGADGTRLDDSSDSWAGLKTAEPGAAAASRATRKDRRPGKHRLPPPPGALKGRTAVVAVAAGAAVAAGQTGIATSAYHSRAVDRQGGPADAIAAQTPIATDTSLSDATSPQVLNVGAATDLTQFDGILRNGEQFAADLAAASSAKLPPLWAKFAEGTLTSGFGQRWGAMHPGVDVAGAFGSPIRAVADGVVLEAGPANGFGLWVRVGHDDGTVTVYGHVDAITVEAGQRVTAGDQIATMGNRGFSTGTHVHFEVWKYGSDKIDPIPWLASRGIDLGPERD